MSNDRKTIFLDMDGVIAATIQMAFERHDFGGTPRGTSHIDAGRANLFLNCIKDLDVDVVLSSTWRKKTAFESGPETFREYFFERIGRPINVVGYTGVHPTGFRGLEIEEYIKQHEITNYVILDDDSDFLPTQAPRHVPICPVVGLTLKDMMIALMILGVKNDLTAMAGKVIRWHNFFNRNDVNTFEAFAR